MRFCFGMTDDKSHAAALATKRLAVRRMNRRFGRFGVHSVRHRGRNSKSMEKRLSNACDAGRQPHATN